MCPGLGDSDRWLRQDHEGIKLLRTRLQALCVCLCVCVSVCLSVQGLCARPYKGLSTGGERVVACRASAGVGWRVRGCRGSEGFSPPPERGVLAGLSPRAALSPRVSRRVPSVRNSAPRPRDPAQGAYAGSPPGQGARLV